MVIFRAASEMVCVFSSTYYIKKKYYQSSLFKCYLFCKDNINTLISQICLALRLAFRFSSSYQFIILFTGFLGTMKHNPLLT